MFHSVCPFQECLRSCQDLMEEVLHLSVKSDDKSRNIVMDPESLPSTPTDLQDIHF